MPAAAMVAPTSPSFFTCWLVVVDNVKATKTENQPGMQTVARIGKRMTRAFVGTFDPDQYLHSFFLAERADEDHTFPTKRGRNKSRPDPILAANLARCKDIFC